MTAIEDDEQTASRLEFERSQRSEGWRLLRQMLRKQRRNLLIGAVVGTSWAAVKVTVPQLTKLAIDRGIAMGESTITWATMIGVLGVMVGLLSAMRRYIAFRESRWSETLFREELYAHVLRLHVAYHDRAQTGQLMSRASSDLNQIQQFVVMIPITLSNLVQIVAVTAILFLTDPVLAVCALLPLPLVNVAARHFSGRIHAAVLAVQAEQAELANVVEESVSGVRVIKGFGAEDVQYEKLAKEADDIRRESLKAARIRSSFLPAIDVLPALGLVAVLGVGGHRVVSGAISIGDLVAFNVYLTLLVWPLRNIGMIIALGQRAAAALVRIHEVLSVTPAVASPQRPEAPSEGGLGEVRFEHVRFGYDPDRPVVRDLSVRIAAGESVAVVGATGSGKSTLVRLLLRFYDVDSGHVLLDGVDVRRLDLHELRRSIGVVFEDTLLFNDTVSANVSFADPAATTEQIEAAARLAGAHEFISRLPEGYDTVIGERGYSLSGGQRQRIAIARAILADPRVLVLDDATSAVDPSKEGEIREAMRSVMRGRTTLVIAHRPGTIALADRVLLIDDGKVAAEGRHDDLVATNARYREVLASMATSDEVV